MHTRSKKPKHSGQSRSIYNCQATHSTNIATNNKEWSQGRPSASTSSPQTESCPRNHPRQRQYRALVTHPRQDNHHSFVNFFHCRHQRSWWSPGQPWVGMGGRWVGAGRGKWDVLKSAYGSLAEHLYSAEVSRSITRSPSYFLPVRDDIRTI